MANEHPWVAPEIFSEMVAFRRDLHRAPELSGEEEKTAAAIAGLLREAGLAPRVGVGGHGLYVDLPGTEAGGLVALRADMDALPVREETGLPFASEVPGVMHACGHDAHSSMLLGAMRLLVASPPPRPVRLASRRAGDRRPSNGGGWVP